MKRLIVSGVDITHARLAELSKLADQARPFYDWLEARFQKRLISRRTLDEILLTASKSEIRAAILDCYAAAAEPNFGKRGGTPESGKNRGNPNLHNGRWDQAFHPLGRNKRTVWDIPLGKFRDAHFAVFPEALARTCILAGSRAGDLVLDPFMGSGTTAYVAKGLGRRFLGIELVPQYADMALKRISTVNYQPELFADRE